MAEVEAKCPSGLHVTVRGLKGQELDTFANEQHAKKANIALEVASACTRKVLDAGPYTLQPDGSLPWGSLLVGDLTYLNLMVRQASFEGTRDEKFTFRVRCPDKSCDHSESPIQWELDLQNDLPVQRWTDADRAKYQEGGGTYFIKVNLLGYSDDPDFHKIEDGPYLIEHKLMCAKDQKRTRAKNIDPAHQATQALMRRIVKIQREGSEEPIDRNDILPWLGELDLVDIDTIVEAMDANDCGVDTTIPVECPQCGEEWEVELPFDRFWKRRKARS